VGPTQETATILGAVALWLPVQTPMRIGSGSAVGETAVINTTINVNDIHAHNSWCAVSLFFATVDWVRLSSCTTISVKFSAKTRMLLHVCVQGVSHSIGTFGTNCPR